MSDQVRVLGKQVLLVEDDLGARESIKLLLTIDRHRVTEAKNGRHAMELFSKYFFDLVIIDYFMPQMQGKELADNLKRIVANVPILMITAYAEKLVDMDIQVDSILPKPFGVADLRQAIARLVKA
jgi:CheY-like chemotaxis protein